MQYIKLTQLHPFKLDHTEQLHPNCTIVFRVNSLALMCWRDPLAEHDELLLEAKRQAATLHGYSLICYTSRQTALLTCNAWLCVFLVQCISGQVHIPSGECNAVVNAHYLAHWNLASGQNPVLIFSWCCLLAWRQEFQRERKTEIWNIWNFLIVCHKVTVDPLTIVWHHGAWDLSLGRCH